MTAVPIELPDEPGWSTVSVGHIHVLVRAGGALVERVRLAAHDGDLDDVLDALSADGVRATPDFVAVLEGSPLRVVARGSGYAVASGPAGAIELRATGRGPWVDQDAAADVTAVTLHAGAASPQPATPVADTQLPPASEPGSDGGTGWKLPSVFARGRAEEPEPQPASDSGAPATDAAAADEPVTPPAAEVEDLPSYDHLFGATQHDRSSYLEKHDTQGISEPPIGHAPIEAAGGFDPRDSRRRAGPTGPPRAHPRPAARHHPAGRQACATGWVALGRPRAAPASAEDRPDRLGAVAQRRLERACPRPGAAAGPRDAATPHSHPSRLPSRRCPSEAGGRAARRPGSDLRRRGRRRRHGRPQCAPRRARRHGQWPRRAGRPLPRGPPQPAALGRLPAVRARDPAAAAVPDRPAAARPAAPRVRRRRAASTAASCWAARRRSTPSSPRRTAPHLVRVDLRRRTTSPATTSRSSSRAGTCSSATSARPTAPPSPCRASTRCGCARATSRSSSPAPSSRWPTRSA